MPFEPMDVSRYTNIRFMSPRAGLSQSIQDLMNRANSREIIYDSRGDGHLSQERAIIANQVIEAQNGLPDCTHGNADRLEEEMRRRSDEAAGEKGDE